MIKGFQPIVVKFVNKLIKWKANMRSIGRRSIPFSCLHTKFFWGGQNEVCKIHWINWDLVMSSKEKGGTGICILKAFNPSLLQKKRWSFIN